MNPATLSGAIDVVVVKQENGDLNCSPFHIRFGKLKLLQPSDKVVEILINGKLIDIPMKVGEAGEAFFVVESNNPVPSEYATSPIITAADPAIDNDFHNFQLTPIVDVDSPKQLGAITAVKVESFMKDLTLDQELSNLHIGSNYRGDEPILDTESLDSQLNSSPLFKKQPINSEPIQNISSISGSVPGNSSSIHVASSISIDPPSVNPFPITGSQKSFREQDLANMPPNSPPWVWNWGGLPERSREDLFDQSYDLKTRKLRNRISTPILKGEQKSSAPEFESSLSEKVDSFLIGMDKTNERNIAIEQELTEEKLVLLLEGDKDEEQHQLIMSQCGPLTTFSKLLPEVFLI
jgi:hypothetical protein